MGSTADGSDRLMTLWAFLWERRWFWLGPPLVTLALLIGLALWNATH